MKYVSCPNLPAAWDSVPPSLLTGCSVPSSEAGRAGSMKYYICTGGHSPGYFLLSRSWAASTLQVLALPLEHTNEYYNPFTSHEYFQKTNNNLKENRMLHSMLIVWFSCCSFIYAWRVGSITSHVPFYSCWQLPPVSCPCTSFAQTSLSTTGMISGVLERMESDSLWGAGKDKRPRDTKSDRHVASKKTVITYKRKKLFTWRIPWYWTRDPTLKSLTMPTFKGLLNWETCPSSHVPCSSERGLNQRLPEVTSNVNYIIIQWWGKKIPDCYSCIPLIHKCFPAHQNELE